MKTILLNFLAAMVVAASLQTHAQSTLIIDQQSAANPTTANGDGLNIQEDSPLMQSFVPALNAIGFVSLEFWDIANNGTNGATVEVNLWEGSPDTNSATLISSTTPVYMPNGFVNNGLGFAGVATFNFSTAITLIAGDTYYLEPVVLSGDNPWDVLVIGDTYANGRLYGSTGGYFQPATDFWFQEGVVAVPEPSSFALVGVAGLFFVFKRRKAFFPALLLVAGLFVFSQSSAQASVYYLQSLGGVSSAPFPMNPDPSDTVEEVSTGVYVVEDGAPVASSRFHAMTSYSSPPVPGGTNSDGGTNEYYLPGSTPQSYNSNDLWLEITGVTNAISYLTIHVPWNIDVDSTNWNLFYTTNLATPFTNWWWILTTDYGQTNLAVPNAVDAQGFYVLGYPTIDANQPIANGDNEPPIPPNSISNSVTLVASDPNNLPLTYILLTCPTNGVLTGTPPNLYYTPDSCFEGGGDSFTYMASDGVNRSAPATVNIYVEQDFVFASSTSMQTCRNTSNSIALYGSDTYGLPLSWMQVISPPEHGSLSATNGSVSGHYGNVIYTPVSGYTGTDKFYYEVFNDCGDYDAELVTITVGDQNLQTFGQKLLTGTNQPLTVTLSAVDTSDSCNADTNIYTYTITTSPTNGTLTGAAPHLTYTPHTGFEGQDSFSFKASDGSWSSSPATVTIYTVAPPELGSECNFYNSAVHLVWGLDTNTATAEQQYDFINDYVIYSATNAGGPFTAIATNSGSVMEYWDFSAAIGQTNYYEVTIQLLDSHSGIYSTSPLSNEIGVFGQTLGNLITPDAYWNVVTNLADPTNVTSLQAPFGSPDYENEVQPALVPVNTIWNGYVNGNFNDWSNSATLNLTGYSSQQLTNVTYAIAIDDHYALYVNNVLVTNDTSHTGLASWSEFQALPGLGASNNLVGVVIHDIGNNNDYFSMIVTTNTCGW